MSYRHGVIGLLALVAGCDDDNEASIPATTQSADTATAWFDLELALVRDTPGFTPPVASRAFAYAGVTLYEAIVHGTDRASLAGQLTDLGPLPEPQHDAVYDWPAVANAALASITRDMFATSDQLGAVDQLEAAQANGHARTVSTDVLERSAAYGREVAGAIYAWSRSDGADEAYAHNFPSGYVPPVGPGMWVPTPPMYLAAMQPYWGMNRTFVLARADECELDMPPAYSTQPGSRFHGEGYDVYTTTSHLTPEQEQIARFWSDDPVATATPPGHWISITTQVLADQHATLDVAAAAYAAVGLAVGDAFIACWATKYHDNVVRPVTYIQEVFDRTWKPLLVTPPFPEYPSGHSVQSAAAAVVLTDLFGETAFTDHTNDARGLPPRMFASFDAAAEEAAISRLYGGIHYRAAIMDGLDMGRCVGAHVSALALER